MNVNESGDVVKTGLLGYASRLKFPYLFLLTLGLFLADLIVPDIIPFIDEILLGLGALILGLVRTRARDAVVGYRSAGTVEGTAGPKREEGAA
jgi:hypothetical protein